MTGETAGRGRLGSALTVLLVGLVGLTGALILASPASTATSSTATRARMRAAEADPLTITLDHVSPAVVPDRGPVVLGGTVTNTSDDTWTDVNVYPFLSPTPVTSTADLAEAASTASDQVPGGRIVEVDRPATLDTLDRLDPGDSTAFSVRIPHDLLEATLAGTPGVYWFGVQALGADSSGRDTLSDGRAYTFLPLLGRRPTTTRVAVVVPVRRSVGYHRDGSLRGLRAWRHDLGPDGRLSRLLALGEAAPAGGLTWLIDPAVLDAVTRLSQGDPPRSLQTPTDGSPSTSAGPDAGDDGDGGDQSQAPDADDSGDSAEATLHAVLRTRAADWLSRFVVVARRDSVLGLPYGDLDVAAASQRDPALLRRAVTLSATVFDDLDIGAQPAVSAPSGWVKPTSVAALDAGTTILAADTAAAAALPAARSRPVSVEVGTHTVDLYDAAASSGGPGPTDPTAGVALRQRLLAEAALRSRQDDPQPLVVSLPTYWDPGPRPAALLAGLGRRWLELVPQPAVLDSDAPQVSLGDLVYPERELDAELPVSSFTAAERLRGSGDALQNLLVGPTTVGRQVTAQALTGVSYADRAQPGRTAGRTRSAGDRVAEDLAQVTIDSPPFVTLASDSGNRFRVDLTNGLPEAVRVRIDPVVDEGLRIVTPGVIIIQGNAKASVLLTVRSERLGFHQVDLRLTTPKGSQLGTSAALPIRSSRTGRIIWVILGAGAALLFGAIATRLVRRLARSRARRRARRRAARRAAAKRAGTP